MYISAPDADCIKVILMLCGAQASMAVSICCARAFADSHHAMLAPHCLRDLCVLLCVCVSRRVENLTT